MKECRLARHKTRVDYIQGKPRRPLDTSADTFKCVQQMDDTQPYDAESRGWQWKVCAQ